MSAEGVNEPRWNDGVVGTTSYLSPGAIPEVLVVDGGLESAEQLSDFDTLTIDALSGDLIVDSLTSVVVIPEANFFSGAVGALMLTDPQAAKRYLLEGDSHPFEVQLIRRWCGKRWLKLILLRR